MNNENTKKYINLPPFKGWVLENFPFIEEDFDAITNYQMMCKIIGYLNVIKDNNDYIQNNEIKPLYDAFVSLKEYVDNYFDNLDIQAEVDAKLDEMAEHGELAEIIAQYLQVNAVLGFNTKADLKLAENLVNGSITRTIGNNTYNDGKGNYYKIRTITSEDVIDDDNILALSNYPTLIAEKLPNYDINNIYNILNTINETTIPAIQEDLSALGEQISPLETKIDNEIVNRITNEQTIKNLVVIGDSYGIMDGVTNYNVYIQQYLGLDNNHFYNKCEHGAGFIRLASSFKTFDELTTELQSDLTAERRDAVTHVLIAGGYNDLNHNYNDLISAIGTCITNVHNTFPNAQIYVAYIGWSASNVDLQATYDAYYNGTIQTKYGKYITNTQNILTNNLLSITNANHPNQDGFESLARNLIEGLQTGTCHPTQQWIDIFDVNNNHIGVAQQNNNIITFMFNNYSIDITGTADGTSKTLFTLKDNSMVRGKHNYKFVVPCWLFNLNGNPNQHITGTAVVSILDGIVSVKPYGLTSDGTSWFNYTRINLPENCLYIEHKNC